MSTMRTGNKFLSNSDELRIKICGLTTKEDIEMCAKYGVNAVGFLLQTKDEKEQIVGDKVSVDIAKKLAKIANNNSLASVVLIKSAELDCITNIINKIKPDSIQLQSKIISNDTIAKIRSSHMDVEIIRTIHIGASDNAEDIFSSIESALNDVDAVLLDSEKGGTGKTHDWSLSAKLRGLISNTKVILAGGLTSMNVCNGIEKINPDAVDVMTGVTSEVKGIKCDRKVNEFVGAVKAYKVDIKK